MATEGFSGAVACTGDDRNATIARFGGKPLHKARVYTAVDSAGAPAPNTVIIGWEYSANDDFQDMVTLVQNVRPA